MTDNPYDIKQQEADELLKRSRIGTKEKPGVWVEEMLDVAKERDGLMSSTAARKILKSDYNKFGLDGLHKKKQITVRQWFEALCDEDPTIIGIRPGANQAEAMDPKLVRSWLQDGNMTAFSTLAAQHNILKLHAVARQHGKRDAFDRSSPYKDVQIKKEGEPDKAPPRNAADNPWINFNLTAQGRISRDNPALAKKLMQEAQVAKLGMTQKQLRGAR